ncbi:MAG: tRNA glutamyl-Q(34) synthetase GluQRS [Propionicimonas sp.]|uniref:tRNA glutamyl-Q(34) synthetase GluQRS n=1 Tax=Propionicimonas sp. TaxID=1955623 RepID=UPI002B1E9B72|nr:tRNA glutamyl-Q(34) synthetase GluQRS [Propionicimonas sp.]MEA4944045.1 tRNA glutamyl-Q(34) synthetase GluQRS [Propionicimonas sp.]
MAGRYAPSPTSALHLGNLRTALVAWLMARHTGREFRLRIEDLDTARVTAAGDVAAGQLADLRALGLDFDPPVLWQSRRLAAYAEAAASVGDRLYECFCTRREIAEAASAPHAGGFRPYPGTCRNLTEAERAARRRQRRPALRLRADAAVQTVHDQWAGEVTGVVDDFVVRRNDGVWAYNFAVVVDDLAQGVDQVVRGDDLLSSSPRQAWLTRLLGGRPPSYAHVPLAVNPTGTRLAKRDGAVTLADLAVAGVGPQQVLGLIATSLGLADPGERVDSGLLLDRFEPSVLPREPWVVPVV